mmetsp:Transcript_7282/g.14454  ORF Transcript_7282/g.14454 Transcript_7282/m.14454 type:complete len:215 (+) Transcript_7282:572-1216(+)
MRADRPKSAIFTWLYSGEFLSPESISRFSGFRSLCTVPTECMCSMPSITCRMTLAASFSEKWPKSRIRSKSSPPVANSSTRCTAFASSNTSNKRIHRGWSIFLITSISCCNSSMSNISWLRSKVLMATLAPLSFRVAIRAVANEPDPKVFPISYLSCMFPPSFFVTPPSALSVAATPDVCFEFPQPILTKGRVPSRQTPHGRISWQESDRKKQG